MVNANPFYSRSLRSFFMTALALLMLGVCAAPANATKQVMFLSCQGTDCSQSSMIPNNKLIIGHFQTVLWSAKVVNGNEGTFSLKPDSGQPIPLISDKPLEKHPLQLVKGSYTLTVTTTGTMSVELTVYYDLDLPSLKILPPATEIPNANGCAFSFMPVTDGKKSVLLTFTLKFLGDNDLSAKIQDITADDGTHFLLSSIPPKNSSLPSSGSKFFVQYSADEGPNNSTVPISHQGTITATATTELGAVISTTLVVCGTTDPKGPDIDCGDEGPPKILGEADWSTNSEKVLPVKIYNKGGKNLTIKQIAISGNPEGVFKVLTPLPIIVPPGAAPGFVQVNFKPTHEGSFVGTLLYESDSPGEKNKECKFEAWGHHPRPQPRVELSSIPKGPQVERDALKNVNARTLDYHDVEMRFTSTRAITVYNDGDAKLRVEVIDKCPTGAACENDEDHQQWTAREKNPGSEIPAKPENGAAPNHPFLMPFKPTAPSDKPHEIVMTVKVSDPRISNADPDPARQTIDITLKGRGIEAVQLDSVLVLDRSSSMGEFLAGKAPNPNLTGPVNKITALHSAASLYLDLLRPNSQAGSNDADRVGLVSYNQDSDAFLPLTFVEPDVVNEAKANIQNLEPAGLTGIGGAMEKGAALFPLDEDQRRQVMVVLTDGIQNQTPYVAEALDQISKAPRAHTPIKMFSVGLGNSDPAKGDVTIDADVLRNITGCDKDPDRCNDLTYQVSEHLDDVDRYDLETFYFKIFTHAVGMQNAVDPSTRLKINGSAPIIVSKAQIVSSDHSAIFLVLDDAPTRPFYTLEIVTPGGQVLSPSASVGGVSVQQLTSLNYTIYKVVFPDESQAADYVGEWILRLVPDGTWSDAAVKKALGCTADVSIRKSASREIRPAAFTFAQTLPRDTPCSRFQEHPDSVNPFNGDAVVGFAAAVGSDYRMAVLVQASSSLPTADVKLTATLTDRDMPAPNGEVFVSVTMPGGTTVLPEIRLFDDGTHGDAVAGDATFTTHFLQTLLPGTYQFLFRGLGRNERGELAPREEARYVILSLPPTIPPGHGGSDGRWGRAPWLSLHFGYSVPLGSFKQQVNAGPSLTVDGELPLSAAFSLYGMYGYHRFRPEIPGGPHFAQHHFSFNLRGYVPLGNAIRGFLQIGPGVYFQKGGPTHFGYNVGAGIDIPLVLPKLALELGLDFHHVDPGGLNRRFLDPKVGIKFRF